MRKWKVTCEGILTTILSVVDKKIENELVVKTIINCDCSSCKDCKYETFVILNTEVKDFCITQGYLVI